MSRVEPKLEHGSLLKHNQMLWAPLYAAALDLIGTTGTILPIGDPHHGQPNATTFTTVGAEQVTFTWSEVPSGFDTPLAYPGSFQGIIPIVKFNGTDEQADSPDAAYWERDDASDEGFSLGGWVNLVDATDSTLLAKQGGSSEGSWKLGFSGGDDLQLACADESADLTVTRATNVAMTQGVWIHAVATYDGSGGSSAMDGVLLYVDGVAVASTASNNGSYVAMEDTTDVVSLGYRGEGSLYMDGTIAGGPLGPFFTQTVLSADAIKRLYNLGRAAMAL